MTVGQHMGIDTLVRDFKTGQDYASKQKDYATSSN